MSDEPLAQPFAVAPSGDPAWLQLEQNAAYPGNDAWLQFVQAVSSPGSDPAWLEIES